MRNGFLKIVFALIFTAFNPISGFSQVFFEELVFDGYGKALEGLKERTKGSKNNRNHKPKKLHPPKYKKLHTKGIDVSLAILLFPYHNISRERQISTVSKDFISGSIS